MIIISKFYDYYDKINAYGIDETIYYKRIREKIKIKSGYIPWTGYLQNYSIYLEYLTYNERINNKIIGLQLYNIGFCGNIYPMVSIIYRDVETENRFFYSGKRLLDELVLNGFFKYNAITNRNRYYQHILDFFDARKYTKSNYIELFRKHHTPIFAVRIEDSGNNVITINPRLSDYYFESVIDPFTAHQEISGYISGVLGVDENPMIQLNDTLMRDKKGFDKMSFKKHKTKKR